MSIQHNRKYHFFWQKNNCDYNYNNKGFITISTTTMDFTKLQEAATTSKEALAKKTTETQKALEQSFVDAMKSWEDAVKAKETEASKDTTKSSEALQARSNFDTFKNNLETEVRNLLTQEQAEKKEVEQQTKTETEKLLDTITQDSVAIISAAKDLYKDKTRADMIQMENLPSYINAVQTIIIQLGASTWLDDKSMDRIWPITKAGVKTIQKYLNDTYQAGLDIDGVPGPKTLEQLLSPVSSTDSTTRLENMLSEKPTLTLFSVEVVSTTKTNKKTNTSWDKWWTKQENEVVTIEDANKEIPEKVIDAKLKELKKLYPKLDDAFLKAWAKAIISLKASTTLWEFIYDNKTYYFDSDRSISRTKSKIDKTWATTKVDKVIDENIDTQTTVDNNIIKVNEKRIESWLNQYIHSNLISFEGEKNRILCDEYYQKYIINLKNVKIVTSKLTDWKTRINFLENWGYTKYFIDLMPKDFIKKWTNDINYETINIAIKKDIISRIQKDIEQKEASKLQQRYFELKDYLEDTYFPIHSLYSKQEQKNTFVQAFFEDFPRWIEFNRYDSTFNKKNKTIKFEFDNKGSKNKYGYGIMDINSKFTKDGKLDKAAVKRDIKLIIDHKIKKDNPIYNTIKNTSSSTWNNYNE